MTHKEEEIERAEEKILTRLGWDKKGLERLQDLLSVSVDPNAVLKVFRLAVGLEVANEALRNALATRTAQGRDEVPPQLLAWWESFRPTGYDLKSHLENPIVNMSTKAEMGLARYVEGQLKSGQTKEV